MTSTKYEKTLSDMHVAVLRTSGCKAFNAISLLYYGDSSKPSHNSL